MLLEKSTSSVKQQSAYPYHLVVACVFFLLLVTVGAIPGYAKAASALVNDKILHFAAYASLSGLIYSGLGGGWASRALRTMLVIAVLGGIDETIQRSMPYRNADWIDWEFDILAALSCATALAMLHAIRIETTRRIINKP